jgi:hypothetical protein
MLYRTFFLLKLDFEHEIFLSLSACTSGAGISALLCWKFLDIENKVVVDANRLSLGCTGAVYRLTYTHQLGWSWNKM